VIQYRTEGEDNPRANAPSYTIHITHTKTLNVSDLIEHITSEDVNATIGNEQEVLQALNIFLGHYAKSSSAFATVGSKKIYSLNQGANGWDLGAGLTALRGFFSSVRVATRRILVNINISHGAFYDAIPLAQLMDKYGHAHQKDLVKLQYFLKRVRVKVIHLAEENKAGRATARVKTIFGLARSDDGTPDDGQRVIHPPRVQKFGAGPQDVEFFRQDSVGGPAGSSTSQVTGNADGHSPGDGGNVGSSNNGPDQDAPQGSYISVFNHFKNGMCFINAKLYALLIVNSPQ
jgi:eukaryotic translation initiation factor 2C